MNIGILLLTLGFIMLFITITLIIKAANQAKELKNKDIKLEIKYSEKEKNNQK